MTIYADMRDATQYVNPGKARRYHIVVNGHAACNSNVALLGGEDVPHVQIQAAQVHEVLRCRRRGCRERWP